MNDVSLIGIILITIATIIAAGRPLVRGVRQGHNPSRQSPPESEEIRELLTQRNQRLNRLLFSLLGTGIWLWVFGEAKEWNDGAICIGWLFTGFLVPCAAILLYYWVNFVIQIGKMRQASGGAGVTCQGIPVGPRNARTRYQWPIAIIVYLVSSIFFIHYFFNTPTGEAPFVISSRVLSSKYYPGVNKWDPPGTLLTFEDGRGGFTERICGDQTGEVEENRAYRIEVRGIEDRSHSYLLSNGPQHACGKLVRVEEISSAMDEKQVSGNIVSVSGRYPLDYAFTVEIEDSQKKRESLQFCDDPIGFPAQKSSALELVSHLVNSGPATSIYNAAERSAHFKCYALLALRNDSNGVVLESWNVPLLYPATRAVLETGFTPAQSAAHLSLSQGGVDGDSASGIASADICEAVALRDVRAIEDSSSIIKGGEHDTAITQYTVNKETGLKAFCSHGGYCYPAESLQLTNCAIDKTSFASSR